VLTLVERKSRYTLVGKVRNLQASAVCGAARAVLDELPARLRRTATFDNGKEFAEHDQLAAQLGLAIYFAQPYAAWQRGTNENTNGLLRQFHPKGTDFAAVRPSTLQKTADLLNHRPRKCLDYRTPAEVLKTRCGVAIED
jgi:transposase, IS30 family